MANEIQICNLALSHIGGFSGIQSFAENTKPARQCKILYAFARDAALEAHDWGFARKSALLTLLGDAYLEWSYAYQVPPDCVSPRRIHNAAGPNAPKIEYDLMTDNSLTQKIIATDEQNAKLVYTAKVTDPNLFSALFIDALAFRLAADLAMPLKGKQTLHTGFTQRFFFVIGQAKVAQANAEQKKPDSINTIVRSRG